MVLLVGGLLLHRSHARASERARVRQAVERAEAALLQKDYAAACRRAEEATLLAQQQSHLFSAEERSEQQRVLERVQRRGESLARLETAVGRDRSLERCVSTLSSLLAQAESADDAELTQTIRARLDESILAYAREMQGQEQSAETHRASLEAFRAQFSSHLTSAAAEQLTSMTEKGVAQADERFRTEIAGAFDRAAQQVRGGSPQVALQVLSDTRRRLASAPASLAGELLKGFEAVLEALRAGEDLPADGPFQPSADARKPLAALFAIQGYVERLTDHGAHLGVARDAARVRQRVAAIAQGQDALRRFAQGKLQEEVAEAQAAIRFLGPKIARQRSDDPAEQREAWLAAMTLHAGMSRPDVAFVSGDFACTAAALKTALTVDGVKVRVTIPSDAFGKRIRVAARGYQFTASWAPTLSRIIHGAARAATQMLDVEFRTFKPPTRAL